MILFCSHWHLTYAKKIGHGPTDSITYETKDCIIWRCTCLGGSSASHLGPKVVAVTSVSVLDVAGCVVSGELVVVDELEYVVVAGGMDGDGEVSQDVEIFTIWQVGLQYAVKRQPKPSVTL